MAGNIYASVVKRNYALRAFCWSKTAGISAPYGKFPTSRRFVFVIISKRTQMAGTTLAP
jgi:hypothetical protein